MLPLTSKNIILLLSNQSLRRTKVKLMHLQDKMLNNVENLTIIKLSPKITNTCSIVFGHYEKNFLNNYQTAFTHTRVCIGCGFFYAGFIVIHVSK